VLGSVAVMDIEIDDPHPLDAVPVLQITGGNGHVVEVTESHGFVGFGMMARRPDRTKGVVQIPIHHLAGNYPFVVMDNEAGMEHISRLTTKDVDILLIVTDTSRRGLQAAVRIDELARSLNIGVGKSYVIINQVKNGLSEKALEMIKTAGLELAGTVPDDNAIYEYDFNGQPTIEMPEDSPSIQAAFKIFEKIVA